MDHQPKKCWICGDDAVTGEHMIKASDLRAQFGHFSQHKPLYMHFGRARNVPIRGKNVALLKYNDTLCAKCNNERTQRHDRAWEKLSNYLISNESPISKNMARLDLSKVYGSNVANELVNLQLFFVKQFGCLIVENTVPMDVSEFAKCILENRPHPDIFLEVGTGFEDSRAKLVSRTALNTLAYDEKICFGHWVYIVDIVAVRVYYANCAHRRYGVLKHTVHPLQPRKRLRIVRH